MIWWHANAALESDAEAGSGSLWKPPPPSLTLSYDRVDVWRVPLEMPDRERDLLEAVLSAEERARASRFRHHVDRARFVAARGALRAILGRCVGVEPSCLRFSYGRFGKPTLSEPFGANSIEFNLSHSGEIALVAASVGRRLGIDLERIDASRSGQEIAERFFSTREIAALRAVPCERQADAFFACWTRKEAYLKARGDGLSLPLDRFSVSVSPEEPVSLLDCDDDETQRWVLQDLSPGAGWAAALAVEGGGWQLRRWRWRGDPGSSVRSTSLDRPGSDAARPARFSSDNAAGIRLHWLEDASEAPGEGTRCAPLPENVRDQLRRLEPPPGTGIGSTDFRKWPT